MKYVAGIHMKSNIFLDLFFSQIKPYQHVMHSIFQTVLFFRVYISHLHKNLKRVDVY